MSALKVSVLQMEIILGLNKAFVNCKVNFCKHNLQTNYNCKKCLCQRAKLHLIVGVVIVVVVMVPGGNEVPPYFIKLRTK